jgi:hypothetical protein
VGFIQKLTMARRLGGALTSSFQFLAEAVLRNDRRPLALSCGLRASSLMALYMALDDWATDDLHPFKFAPAATMPS